MIDSYWLVLSHCCETCSYFLKWFITSEFKLQYLWVFRSIYQLIRVYLVIILVPVLVYIGPSIDVIVFSTNEVCLHHVLVENFLKSDRYNLRAIWSCLQTEMSAAATHAGMEGGASTVWTGTFACVRKGGPGTTAKGVSEEWT